MGQILQFVLNNGGRGQNGSNSPIRAEPWGVKGVGGAKMDQILQWGAKGVGGAKMGQILQFVLNNGGG